MRRQSMFVLLASAGIALGASVSLNACASMTPERLARERQSAVQAIEDIRAEREALVVRGATPDDLATYDRTTTPIIDGATKGIAVADAALERHAKGEDFGTALIGAAASQFGGPIGSLVYLGIGYLIRARQAANADRAWDEAAYDEWRRSRGLAPANAAPMPIPVAPIITPT